MQFVCGDRDCPIKLHPILIHYILLLTVPLLRLLHVLDSGRSRVEINSFPVKQKTGMFRLWALH